MATQKTPGQPVKHIVSFLRPIFIFFISCMLGDYVSASEAVFPIVQMIPEVIKAFRGLCGYRPPGWESPRRRRKSRKGPGRRRRPASSGSP